jgi:hypothetical protein
MLSLCVHSYPRMLLHFNRSLCVFEGREYWVRLLSFSCEICGSEGGDCEDYCAEGICCHVLLLISDDVSENVRIYWPFSLVSLRHESLSFISRASDFCTLRFVVLTKKSEAVGYFETSVLDCFTQAMTSEHFHVTLPHPRIGQKLCVSRNTGVSASLQRIVTTEFLN